MLEFLPPLARWWSRDLDYEIGNKLVNNLLYLARILYSGKINSQFECFRR